MDMDECHRDIDARLNTHLAQAVREHALLDQYADVLRLERTAGMGLSPRLA